MLTQPFRAKSKVGYSPKRKLNSTTWLHSHPSCVREIPKELGRAQTPELNNRGYPNIDGRFFTKEPSSQNIGKNHAKAIDRFDLPPA